MNHHPFAYILATIIVVGTITGHITPQEAQNFAMLVVSLAATKQTSHHIIKPDPDPDPSDPN